MSWLAWMVHKIFLHLQAAALALIIGNNSTSMHICLWTWLSGSMMLFVSFFNDNGSLGFLFVLANLSMLQRLNDFLLCLLEKCCATIERRSKAWWHCIQSHALFSQESFPHNLTLVGKNVQVHHCLSLLTLCALNSFIMEWMLIVFTVFLFSCKSLT